MEEEIRWWSFKFLSLWDAENGHFQRLINTVFFVCAYATKHFIKTASSVPFGKGTCLYFVEKEQELYTCAEPNYPLGEVSMCPHLCCHCSARQDCPSLKVSHWAGLREGLHFLFNSVDEQLFPISQIPPLQKLRPQGK